MIVVTLTLITSLSVCVFIMTKFPKSKVGNWIRNHIITDEDLEPPI
jgi:hypothetical protein